VPERREVGFYSIEGFNSAPGGGRGSYGVRIVLVAEAVEAILRIPERRKEGGRFTDGLLERVRRTVHEADAPFARLDFHDDSFLLLGMHVGGECACFSVNGDRRGQLSRGEVIPLLYECHNIDTPEQAAAIVSTWLMWFNNVALLTDLRQPSAH
jgi:hypothetical protein